MQPPMRYISPASRISLELPADFEVADEDTDAGTAMYADDLDEDADLGGRLLARASEADGDDAALRAADAAAAVDGRRLEQRRDVEVDGQPGVWQLLTYVEDDLEVDVVRHETYVQAGDTVFSIIGLAPGKLGDTYLPVFDHAAQTARLQRG